MRIRYLSKLHLFFSCLSILALIALLYSLQKTRTEYENKAPQMVNLLLQSDHALDRFTSALLSLQRPAGNGELKDYVKSEKEKKVRLQFDILWPSLKDFNLQFSKHIVSTEIFESVRHDIDTFLASSEALMSPTYSLTPQDAKILIYRSNSVADGIRQLGRQYQNSEVLKADAVERQIDRILIFMGLFIGSLLITGGCAIGLLVGNNKRTTKLFNEAKDARTELATTVDELRSGRREQKAKDTFIAAASHDLRQPLHALGIFLSSLDNKVNSDGRKALTGAQSCTEDLNRLFNSLLDLSRLDAGFVKVDNEDFNLRKMLSKLHTELSPKAQTHGISMGLAFHGNSSFAHSDPVLVERIMRNLIENAIMHSQASSIKLAYNCLPEGCSITVSDNGCGIPSTEHEAIFSEYYQLQNPERDRSKGLGLGLSIVKRLTSLLNVKLEISSSEKTGTKFKTILPKSTTQPSLTQRANTKVSNVDYSKLAGSVILVIDDDRHIREAMHMMLSMHGAISVCGETSDDVLEVLAAKQLEPDFIIADYRLRNHLTGDVVITHLREAIDADIPALLITGDTSPNRMASLKDSGFDILHKPIESELFFEKIISILNQESVNDARVLPAVV